MAPLCPTAARIRRVRRVSLLFAFMHGPFKKLAWARLKKLQRQARFRASMQRIADLATPVDWSGALSDSNALQFDMLWD